MEEASRRPFGQAPTGQPVELLTLDNGRVRCEILTFGAALRSLEVPDRTGGRVDVVLGYGALEDYLRYDGYLGAVVGRYANRIAKGRFTLDGKEYALAVNSGPNHLHGEAWASPIGCGRWRRWSGTGRCSPSPAPTGRRATRGT